MNIDPEITAKLLAPVFSVLLGVFVKRYFESRSKLVSFIGHVSAFTLQDQNKTVVHTHSVVIRNTGNKPAHNVRLTHDVLPPNVTVYPQVQYRIEGNPEGAKEIVIPILVPKEQVTVSYLYFPPLLWSQVNKSTKSDEGFAKIINVIPAPQLSRFVLMCFWSLVLIGASFVFYWVVKIILNVI